MTSATTADLLHVREEQVFKRLENDAQFAQNVAVKLRGVNPKVRVDLLAVLLKDEKNLSMIGTVFVEEARQVADEEDLSSDEVFACLALANRGHFNSG
jgi:hypothetical protein